MIRSNIAKGECKGKRKSHFRFDYVEPPPIFYKYKDLFLYGEIFSLVRTERRAVSRGMKGKGERKRQAEEPESDRKSTRLNSSHIEESRMPSSA